MKNYKKFQEIMRELDEREHIRKERERIIEMERDEVRRSIEKFKTQSNWVMVIMVIVAIFWLGIRDYGLVYMLWYLIPTGIILFAYFMRNNIYWAWLWKHLKIFFWVLLATLVAGYVEKKIKDWKDKKD